MDLKVITKGTDNINKCQYTLVNVNAAELSAYLKSDLNDRGINFNSFNSASGEKNSFRKKSDEVKNPPTEIYEYQNFFLMEKDGKYILLDGFRRLLWYNAPKSINILARVYKYEDLDNQKILSLLVHLNHFKFFTDADYFDRGFSLLLRTVFDLNILRYKNAFEAYLSSDKEKSDYSHDFKDSNDKNIAVKDRILNKHFVSDMQFIEEMKNRKAMVNSYFGVLVYMERQKSKKDFDIEQFWKMHTEHAVLNELMGKFEKTGTTGHQHSQKVVNQILEIYRNFFTIMRGENVKKTFAEVTQECKEIRDQINKDDSWTKLTGAKEEFIIEQLIADRLNNKIAVKFKTIVYPNENQNSLPIGLREDMKFHNVIKPSIGLSQHRSAKMNLSFKEKDQLWKTDHFGTNYGSVRNEESSSNSSHKVEIYVNISKEDYKKAIYDHYPKRDKENETWIYSAYDHYKHAVYLAPATISKEKFLRLVTKLDQGEFGNWVRERAQNGCSSPVLVKFIKDNPGKAIMLNEFGNGSRYEIANMVDIDDDK